MQDREAGLALTFICLLVWLFFKHVYFIYAAMAVLLLAMVWPKGMRPFAVIWFGISHVLGGFFSRILLAVIWLLLVVPIGLIRRMAGKDSLRLKGWQKDRNSVFIARNHTYTADDLKNPY